MYHDGQFDDARLAITLLRTLLGLDGVALNYMPVVSLLKENGLVRGAVVRDADEIVVGSRGLGRFRGAFGSVSHALLHEADRPVVIVPQPKTV